MMKKIFLLVAFFVLGKMWSYAQYPITQNIGADSTIVVSKGALQSRLINMLFTDTAQANTQRIRQYAGAQIATTTGGNLNLWVRNATATAWLPINTGSGNNIYTIDGTLLGNRTLTGAGYSLTFNQLSKLLFNADSTTINTDQATILNNGVSTLNVKGATGRIFLMDTTAPADERIYELKSSNGEFYISILNDAQTSNDSAFLITSASRVGINTLNPDSTLKVGGGVNILGGLRVGDLPTSPGTKQLRINAQGQFSVTDTLIDAGGTVTSVGTNNGSGITGGPITTTGTLAIDTTNVIATKASVSGGLAGKLNLSDTAAMLAPYLRAIDTASLSNRINTKLNISDTATMLGNYLNNVGYGLSKAGQVASADSATLSAYYLRRKDSLTVTNPLGYVTQKILADTAAAIRSSDLGGTVTSVATNNGTGITGGTITTSGTLAIDTTIISTRAWRQKGVDSLQANINLKLNISDTASMLNPYLRKVDTASLSNRINQKLNISDTASMLSPYLRSNTAAATYVPQTRTLTINGTTQDLSANRTYNVGTVTSVGLTMPAAFNVANSPVTGSGTLAVTGAGLASQYIRGDGTLANFPGGGGGGGASVSYYLNGSVNQGTFGGNTYYQMNKTPILGAGTDFTTNTNGYIAQFITNAGDPALLNIPAGNWNFELFFSASSGGGTPSYYVELYKYDGTTFTLIASGSTNPDVIVNSAVDAYFSALPVPQTTLTLTDRLAVRIYVTPAGRTITLHTEDNNLCQVVTTFTTGITAINSLTAQVQYLTTGTSGTDFNISSLTDTHTFNLPVASGTNTGKLSNTDWTTFNNKVGGSLVNGYITKATGTNTIDTSQLFQSNGLIGIGTTSPTQKLQVSGSAYVNGQLFAGDTALSVYQVEGILNTPYVLGRKAVNNTLSTEARPTGVMGHVVGRGSIANRLQAANFYTTTDSASTANSTGSLRSVNAWTAHNGSGSLTTAWGSYNIVQNKTTGTITNAYGSVSGVENRGATSTINKLHGTTTEIWNNYGGTIDTAFGQVISIYNNNAASNIGAVYGLSIGKGLISASGGTHYWRNSGTIGTSYGLYLDSSIDVGTTKYALFSNSNSNSYFRAKLGIGTTSPDSAFQVATGAYFQRGIRASGLPQAAGTKALRIDASGTISYADTLIDAGGTVTSVATNNGTGITGGTITTSGTLAIDTLLISTRAWRQKGVDTLQANINLKLNISDTASMLSPYLRKADTTAMLNPYFRLAGVGLKNTGQTVYADTLLLSTRAWRQKGIDSVAALANTKISGSLISGYLTKATGTLTVDTSQIYQNNGNIGIGTISPASGYKVDMVGSLRVGNGSSYNKLTINGNTVGSYLNFQKNGTNKGDIGPYSAVLGGVPPYSGSNDDLTYSSVGGHFFNTNAGVKMYLNNAGNLGLSASPDSMLTVLEGAYFQRGVRMSGLPSAPGTRALRINANGTLSVADTLVDAGGTVTSVATNNGTGITGGTITTTGTLAIDTLLISTRAWRQKGVDSLQANINQKLNISDTASMLSPYLRTNVAAATYVPQTRTITINGTSQDLSANRTYNVGTVTSVATNTGTGITGGTITSSGTIAADTLLLSTRAWRQKGIDSVAALINSNVSGTTNYVAKFTGTNTIGNSQLFDNGTNVGIGTTSPVTKLDVNGDAIFGSQVKLKTYSDAGSSGIYDGATLFANNFFYWNAGRAFFGTNGAERMRILSDGNVGIGTSSPAQLLEIQKNQNATTQLLVSNSDVTNSGSRASVAATSGTVTMRMESIGTLGGYIGTTSNHYVDFWTNATERMRLTSGGNLLVGTTTDAGYKLDVNGSFSTVTSSIYLQYNSGILYHFGGSGDYYQYISGANYLLYNRTATGALTFGTQDTERMRITSGGNVLIGTTTDVSGVGKFVINYGSDANWGIILNNTYTATSNNGYFQRFYNNGTEIATFYAGNAAGSLFNIVGKDGLTFATGGVPTGSERMRIATNGAVRFNAYGSGSFTGTRAYDLSVDASGNIIEVPIGAGTITGSGTTNYIPKWTSSSAIGNSDLITDGSGNLAIAQGNAPTQALNIYRAGSTQTVMAAGNSNTGLNGTYFGVDANGNGIMNTTGAFANIFSTNGSERMRITSGGNVLVGTTTDAGFRLRVNGTSLFGGDAAYNGIYINNNSTTGGGFVAVQQNGNTRGLIAVSGAWIGNTESNMALIAEGGQSLTFFTNGSTTERMRLDASGNLGLGRTPAFRLDVQTSAVSGGVDYVRFQNGASNAAGNAIAILLGDASDNKAEIRATTVDANNGYLGFYTQGSGNRTEKMRLDASGNLGLGVTPSAWGSLMKSYQNPAGSFWGYLTSDIGVVQNGYFDNTNWRYVNSAAASLYQQATGQHIWYQAGSGVAGNPITFTQAMTLLANGNLLVGGTGDAGQRLQITGAARITAGGNTYSTSGLILGSAGVSSGYISTTDNLYIKPNQAANSTSGAIAIQNFSETTVINLSTNGSSYFNAGNVGIGTTSPNTILEANQSTNGDAAIRITNSNAGNNATAQFFANNGTNQTQFFHTGTAYTTGGSQVVNYPNLGGIYNVSTGIALSAAGASGVILFGTGSSQTERMRITSGGNVGIGTTSPIYKLDVQGTSGTVAIRAASNTADDILFYATGTVTGTINAFNSNINATANVGANIINTNSSTGGSYVNVQVPNATSGNPRYILTTSGATNWSMGIKNSSDYLYFNNSDDPSNSSPVMTMTTGSNNVLIGTITDAGYKLDVAGTGRFIQNTSSYSLIVDNYNGSVDQNYLSLRANGTQIGAINRPAGTNDIFLFSYYGNLTFGANTGGNATERMRVTTAGNVLIGATTDAGYKLDVAGTGRFYSALNVPALRVSSNTDSPVANDFVEYLMTMRQTGDYPASLRLISKNSVGSYLAPRLGFFLVPEDNSTYASMVERMTILGNGNIGIGTTSPTYKFDVNNAGNTVARFLNSQTGANADLVIGNGNNSWTQRITGDGTYDYTLINNGTGARVLTALANGNVGIGTTSPAYKLDVNGSGLTARIAGGTSSYPNLTIQSAIYPMIDFTSDDANSANRNWRIASVYNQYGMFEILSSTSAGGSPTTSRLVITNTGNVGIGTSSPNAYGGFTNLQVNNSTGNSLVQVTGSSSTIGSFYAGGGQGQIGTTSNHPFTLFTNDAERMRITSGGNVLVGSTTDGGFKLYVNGTTKSQSTLYLGGNTDMIDPSSNSGFMTIGSNQPIRFTNASTTEYMRITTSGIVGIGTSSPDASVKLQVESSSSSSVRIVSSAASGGDLYITSVNGSGESKIDKQGAAGPLTFYNNGSERMRLTSSGELLINTTTDAGAYYLQVNGDVYASAYYESSDLRLKNVLSERKGSDGINTIAFKWKDGRDSLTHIGYAAQQVEKVLPDAVKTNPNGYKTINYDEVQSLKIANLEQEIAELKKIIKQLIDKK